MTLKEEIIYQSLRLFSLKGYSGTGVNEIIEAAGSSKGGFYNYFASKEDLFNEVLAEAQRKWRERVLYGLAELESPTERIIRLLENYRDRYLKDEENFPGGCIFITFSVELDYQHPELIQGINKGFLGLKNMLERMLEEGKKSGELGDNEDTAMISEMIFAGMLGASVMFGVEKSSATLNKTIQSLIDYVTRLRK